MVYSSFNKGRTMSNPSTPANRPLYPPLWLEKGVLTLRRDSTKRTIFIAVTLGVALGIFGILLRVGTQAPWEMTTKLTFLGAVGGGVPALTMLVVAPVLIEKFRQQHREKQASFEAAEQAWEECKVKEALDVELGKLLEAVGKTAIEQLPLLKIEDLSAYSFTHRKLKGKERAEDLHLQPKEVPHPLMRIEITSENLPHPLPGIVLKYRLKTASQSVFVDTIYPRKIYLRDFRSAAESVFNCIGHNKLFNESDRGGLSINSYLLHTQWQFDQIKALVNGTHPLFELA